MPSSKDQAHLQLCNELRRFRSCLGEDAGAQRELHQAFQDTDPRNRGYIAMTDEVLQMLSEFVPAKHRDRIDFAVIVEHFRIKKNRFDYVAFCTALEKGDTDAASPQKHSQNNKSPSKKTRRNFLLGRTHASSHSRFGEQNDTSETDTQKPKIRVDKRLEAQRLMTQSIRKKFLLGVIGAKSDGFLGVQDALFNLDADGEGYLEEQAFVNHFVPRLKAPLTRAELAFLLSNIRMCGRGRAHNGSAKGYHVDYEQIGILCNLDSDASFSSSDEEVDGPENGLSFAGRSSDHRVMSPMRSSNLGADFLASEKRVQEFLRQHQPSVEPNVVMDTPRSIVTGAEVFLEHAEAIDAQKTGFISEKDFHRILKKCGVNISPTLLGSILSRFTRTADGLISYTSFLHRYDQDPQHSRERRKLKRFLLGLLPSLQSSKAEWITFLQARFEKHDLKVNKIKRGEVSERGKSHLIIADFFSSECLHVLRGKTGPLKLSTEQALEIVALFLAISPSSTPTQIRYYKLIQILRECAQCNQERYECVSSLPVPSSPTKSMMNSPSKRQSSSDEKSTEDGTLSSVGDYLMFHATHRERQNFEKLMDLLLKFHESMPSSAAPLAQSSQSPTKTEALKTKGDIVPIENGVRLALGEKLHVQIQFSM